MRLSGQLLVAILLYEEEQGEIGPLKMPVSCCVPLCRQIGCLGANGEKVSFHRFPRDAELRKKWTVAIKRDEGKNFKICNATRVCSNHFIESDYISGVQSGYKLLRAEAVPTVFCFQPKPRCRKPPRSQPTRNDVAPTQQSSDDVVEDAHLSDVIEALEEKHKSILSADCPSNDLCPKTKELEDVKAAHLWEYNEWKKEISEKNSVIAKLNAEIKKLRESENKLKSKLSALQFSAKRRKDSEDDFKYYTGLPSYSHLALVEYRDPEMEDEN